jgi:hypothetical protein
MLKIEMDEVLAYSYYYDLFGINEKTKNDVDRAPSVLDICWATKSSHPRVCCDITKTPTDD